MNTRPFCCKGRRSAAGAAGAILSGTALVLLPKCPVCVAAWVAVFTGISLSTAAAAHFRVALVMVCLGALGVSVWAAIRRIHGRLG